MILAALAISLTHQSSPGAAFPSNVQYYRARTRSAIFDAWNGWQIQAPNINATEWGVVDAVPPSLVGQSVRTELLVNSIVVPTTLIKDPTGRPVRYAAIRDAKWRHGLNFTTHYYGTLCKVELREWPLGKALPSYALPPEKLSADELKRCLGADDEADWKSTPVQQFIARKGLRRGAKESEVQFAYRVHLAVGLLGQGHALQTEPHVDRIASRYAQQVLSSGYYSGDCGSSASLVTAVLRANNMPAEIVLGKHDAEQYRDAATGEMITQAHARYRVYVTNVGWIVADASNIAFKSASDYPKTFSVDDGDLIVKHGRGGGTYHLNLPLLSASPLDFVWLQIPAFPVFGTGTFDGWKVTESWHVVLH